MNRHNKHQRVRTIYPTLKQIVIGEPDANSEYISASRSGKSPVFLDNYLVLDSFPEEELKKGVKYIVYGQKGTGKTAALRYIESLLQKQRFETEFVIFKKTILEETDIQDFASVPVIDERNVDSERHHHHSLKRVCLYLIIHLMMRSGVKDPGENDGLLSDIWRKIKGHPVTEIVGFAFESIKDVAHSSDVNVEKLTKGKADLNVARLLKRANDSLLRMVIGLAKKSDKKIALFLDEIHFAYRTEEALLNDAMLVRDTITVVNTLNDRFASEQVNIFVYAGIRSEYLEHPVISTADVNHTIESVGHQISWATYKNDAKHPLFEVLLKRFQTSIGDNFSLSDLFRVYINSMNAEQFLARTWSKPRDIVRYFKTARDLYPNKSRLNGKEVNAVWRQYSLASWSEIRTSASPFMSPAAIQVFDEQMREAANAILNEKRSLVYSEFEELMKPVYEKSKGNFKNYFSFQHFITLLYMLGIFGSRHSANDGLRVVQSFHRGNRNYSREGDVYIHPTVLKAFG